MNKFILSCESTADLPFSYLQEKNVPVIFYTYTINGVEYEDNAGRSDSAKAEFYRLIKEGGLPSTSQINEIRYEEFFDSLLQKGDVLHVAFGTGMTPSYHRAVEAVEKLKSKYPNRKIIVVDSLCSSGGYGLLMDCAIELREQGKSMEQIYQWIIENRNKLHHQFFSTDLTLFKRSGRVSGLSAMLAGILDINPLMHLNSEGRIVAYGKVRGLKKTIKKTVDEVMLHIDHGDEYCDKLYVAHSECIDLAKEVISELESRLPKLVGKIKILQIGSIITSHCGKGPVAVFFWGDERK